MSRDHTSKKRDRITKRRQRRLREELADAGIALPLADGLRRSLIEELDDARFPPLHEGVLHTYGAVLVDPSLDDRDVLGAFSTAVVTDGAVLRRLADGRHSFVLRHGETAALLLLDTPHDSEAELVQLRNRSDHPSTAIVQRRSNGVVRVIGPDGLYIWDGARWWTKPYAKPFARAVLDAMPDAPGDILDSLLDFCVHTMSPAGAGACLVWALVGTEPRERQVRPDTRNASCRGPTLFVRSPGPHRVRDLAGRPGHGLRRRRGDRGDPAQNGEP